MKVRDRIFNSRNSWGPEKRIRKVQYKSAPPAPEILPAKAAPIVKWQPMPQPKPLPVLRNGNRVGVTTETKSKKDKAKDRLRIEHELPWVAYNIVKHDEKYKSKPKQKPKQKPDEKPDPLEDPDYFMRPDRFPQDLTNYPYAATKTSPTKTSIKAIPKKTPTKTDDEKKEEDPLKTYKD